MLDIHVRMWSKSRFTYGVTQRCASSLCGLWIALWCDSPFCRLRITLGCGPPFGRLNIALHRFFSLGQLFCGRFLNFLFRLRFLPLFRLSVVTRPPRSTRTPTRTPTMPATSRSRSPFRFITRGVFRAFFSAPPFLCTRSFPTSRFGPSTSPLSATIYVFAIVWGGASTGGPNGTLFRPLFLHYSVRYP